MDTLRRHLLFWARRVYGARGVELSFPKLYNHITEAARFAAKKRGFRRSASATYGHLTLQDKAFLIESYAKASPSINLSGRRHLAWYFGRAVCS